jgi:hypothetical protein
VPRSRSAPNGFARVAPDAPFSFPDLGSRNQFRSLMLALQDFDDGIEKIVRHARLDPSFMAINFQ